MDATKGGRKISPVIPAGIGIGLLVVALLVYVLLPTEKGTVAQEKPEAAPAQGAEQAKTPEPQAVPAIQPVKPALVPVFDITAPRSMPPTDSEASFTEWMLKNTDQKQPYLKAKWERAQEVVNRKEITDQKVLQAFLMAPRQYFCRDFNLKAAYADTAIPIGYGQTISGPHMVARMSQNIKVEPQHRVLEIGTGSGYQSSVLAELCNFVFTIEIVPELTKETDAIYTKLENAGYPQYKNIKRKNADGYYGWEEYAPFDRIVVTCGIDHIPPPLLKQLAPGGIMIIPVGPPSGQTVLKITKNVAPDGTVTLDREDTQKGKKTIFVPFTSAGGGVHSLTTDKPVGAETESGKKEPGKETNQ